MQFRLIPFVLLMLTCHCLIAQTDTAKSEIDSLSPAANIIPVFTVSADELESEEQSQDVSGILQSSRDVFMSIAGFNFSGARYRFRGYSSENTQIMMNGIPMNDRESGWAIWAFWGGLNDVTRYPENRQGISSANMGFGNIGGYSQCQSSFNEFEKGNKNFVCTNKQNV